MEENTGTQAAGQQDGNEDIVKELMDSRTRLYELKLAEKNAEILALQSQINPHFLYNTLSCISNIGIAYDIPEITDISVALSNIYRYSIGERRLVPLDDEIACAEEYMKIMQIRFPNRFEFSVELKEELRQLYVLRMTLQPLVENAVYHGMEMKKGKSHLAIRGELRGDNCLVLRVINDGKLIEPERLQEVRENIKRQERSSLFSDRQEGKGIGLGNINKRIRLQFGEDYGLEIDSSEATGTVVTITMPVMYSPEEQRELQ